MNRRTFLTASVATLLSAAAVPRVLAQAKAAAPAKNPALRTKAGAAIEKGLDFLKKAQKPGGFWSSQDYPGLSGLVVQAFGTAPGGKHKNSEPVRDGLKFIRDSAKADGGIYNKGMGNYNTSIALATLLRAGDAKDQKLIDGARKYLVGAQAVGGASPESDGGFGYEAGNSGRMSRPDMDNTVFALEALALYRDANKAKERPGEKDLNWKAAIDFVSSCQNLPATNKHKWASEAPEEKGGFVYTPGGNDKGTHSYGTMTYAGLLSLIYADVKKDDERVKAAVEWLSKHYSLDQNPGQGEQGLYYYYFVMAKGLTAAGINELEVAGKKVNWREELTNKLLSLQKPDGSWASANGRWMEKDPVLVTAYVLTALNTIHDQI
jgi:squalene-hopene/tetraprenyl-beta-curcumene cyclase